MLRDECVAKRGRDEDAGGEGSILEERETIAKGERVWVNGGEKIGVLLLSCFPFVESSWNLGRQSWNWGGQGAGVMGE